MKVKLLEYTPNAEKLIASAAKLCYSSSGIEDLQNNLDKEKVDKFLNMLMSYGHESPIEHVSFTFGIEGVSRSLTHQLVRHRIGSYSQQSQRYVRLDQFEYVIPPSVEKDEEAKKIYIETMKSCQKSYDNIANILKEKYINNGLRDIDAEKKAIEDARYVFPNACTSKIIVTMNARSLMNFFRHRCCNRAQWEIRELAEIMLFEVKDVAPTLFKYCGPGCVNGPCPEGKMSCGKIKEVREKYNVKLYKESK
ncbi:FAD-dependent thymidylate synthase [Clostridium botulinum]|uniref:Flavin-dependent thymidylate synthase n=2 Tax=Clostridium botulinum TaxID=1491 RepID=A0A846HSK6_CLOBO|nr:FAD-dependent thymidylate synthase [Clostridium botulinum]AJD25826.1 thymidylate synthase, flavin-dependent [Clostridium botulinum CDC_297]ACQ52526.1 thymidylate synthase, flavin-dependent [Clostridium botulinum Ba4 str. 657]AJE11599.1 thymidylate synthase, flavin-dependent [Clostridium botulinum CDC_1436]APR00756.1 thymidylate synthase, flavin-dependent [Clostridium botulinum]APU58754.1 thymidylate synthase, flavin-dependent [Clostridium botulinum]